MRVRDVETWYNRGGDTPFVRIGDVDGGIDADYSVIQEGEIFYALMNGRRFGAFLGDRWEPIPPESPMEDYIQKLPYVDDCVGIQVRERTSNQVGVRDEWVYRCLRLQA